MTVRDLYEMELFGDFEFESIFAGAKGKFEFDLVMKPIRAGEAQ